MSWMPANIFVVNQTSRCGSFIGVVYLASQQIDLLVLFKKNIFHSFIPPEETLFLVLISFLFYHACGAADEILRSEKP